MGRPLRSRLGTSAEQPHSLEIDRLPAERIAGTVGAIREVKSTWGHTHHVITRADIAHLLTGGFIIVADAEYTHSIELEPEIDHAEG